MAATAAVGCATPQTLAPSYAPQTRIELAASARCERQRCRCRPLDSDDDQAEQNVPSGHKRFELRLPRSTSAIWVDVAQRGIYYKRPGDVDPACIYLDLPAGRHQVTIHGAKRDERVGLQSGLTISEYGDKTGPSWYRSFHLACGHAASRCTRDEVEAWKRFQQGLPRGVLDPCGSVMIEKVRFGGKRAERLDRDYEELTVQFSLRVYAFEPHQPPGASTCKGPTKNR